MKNAGRGDGVVSRVISQAGLAMGVVVSFAPTGAFAAEVGVSASASVTPAAVSAEGAQSGSAEGSRDPAGATTAEDAPPAGSATTDDKAGARKGRSPDPYERSTRFGTVPYLQRYRPERNLWEAGLFLGLFLPSGSHNLLSPRLPHEPYQRENLSIGGRLAYFPLSFVGAEVEFMAAPSAVRESGRSALFYSARAHAIVQAPFWSVVPFALVGGGALGAVSETMGHDGDPLVHWGLGLKAPFGEHLSGRFDFRHDLTQRYLSTEGTPANHFELLLGLTFTFNRTAPPPPKDTDHDGLFDSEDRCPEQGAFSADGCPEAPKLAGDKDGDGVTDDVDECPSAAGLAPSGCPDPDADKDGIPAPCDACPAEAGKGRDGCPIRDTDGDGVLDDKDKCAAEPETKNGFEDEDGCPDSVPAAVKKFSGVIGGISFVKDKAEINAKSYPTLNDAVKTLKEYPTVRIEVSGHTSSEGSAERNQELSVERAESVKKYLVDNGVEAERVVARGAGASEPIADNKTRVGREKNRRIEFRILDHDAK